MLRGVFESRVEKGAPVASVKEDLHERARSQERNGLVVVWRFVCRVSFSRVSVPCGVFVRVCAVWRFSFCVVVSRFFVRRVEDSGSESLTSGGADEREFSRESDESGFSRGLLGVGAKCRPS